jgi:excinuclease UvrABC nuclease subunit
MQDDVINAAEAFAEQHNFHFEVHQFQKSDLQDEDNRERQNENWAIFEEQPGVYVFSNEDEDEVIYIGQGGWQSNSNVGSRLADHWKEKPHFWKEATDITIFAWDSEDDNIHELETHLIKKHKPRYNKQHNN